MRITYIGHSCFLIENQEGYKLVVDPYSPSSVPGLADIKGLVADEVAISHSHSDHNYVKGIALRANAKAGQIPGFKTESISTWHDEANGTLRGDNTVRIFYSDSMRIVHMGDIGCGLSDDQIEKLRGADVVMIPVGGYYTVDAGAAFEICEAIDPGVIIPMHYRGETYDYRELDTRQKFVGLCDTHGFNVITSGSVIDDFPKSKVVITMEPLLIL